MKCFRTVGGKQLFTKDEIEFEDFFEARSIQKGAMYLNFGEDIPEDWETNDQARFIGRTGLFVPVIEGVGGGTLYRVFDGKSYSIAGTKGFLWKEADVAKRDEVDMAYFDKLVDKAIKTIENFGSYEDLVA